MRMRALFLPTAAAVIIGLCAYKTTRTYESPRIAAVSAPSPAPLFEGVDSNNRLFRLKSYIGRHPILLVFYSGERGVDQSELLTTLYQHRTELDDAGVVVVGVSGAIPQHNRAAAARLAGTDAEFPFPLVTDIPPPQSTGSLKSGKTPAPFDAHRIWGVYDEADDQPRTGAFLIDRAGNVMFRNGLPEPLSDPQAAIETLIDG